METGNCWHTARRDGGESETTSSCDDDSDLPTMIQSIKTLYVRVDHGSMPPIEFHENTTCMVRSIAHQRMYHWPLNM